MTGYRHVQRNFAALAVALALLANVTVLLETGQACPFCGSASLTLSEQVSAADAMVLVQWAKGQKEEKNKAGSTTFEITQKVKGPATLTKGSRITLERYRAGKSGDLFMLLGTKGDAIEWGSPLETSETCFNYIAQSPSPEAAPLKRLEYFLKFLEVSDPVIANDAFAEFANAPYKDVVALTKELPRDRLRKWISDPEISKTRLGLYGMMLGLCGEKADEELLESKIVESSDDFRLGIDGIIGGYLLLSGDRGLTIIEKQKLADKAVPFSETFAAMQALRFMWTYGDGRISEERLRQSMRILLDRPELADLVIADLARWKDWGIQKQLMQLYTADEYNVPSIKRAIVRYLLVSTRDMAAGTEPPQHVVDGQKYLAELRIKDPKTVAEAERFFVAP